MKIAYASPELEYEALRDEAADLWIWNNREEYTAMLLECFPSGMPKRVGELAFRRGVLDGMVYLKCGFPNWTAWSHQKKAA